MKIRLLTSAIVLLASIQSYAQLKGFSIGPYAEMIWPVGSADQTYNTGIGGGINADIRIMKFGITASAGFVHFGGKTIAGTEGTTKAAAVNAIPIRAGIKYRLVPALYLKLEGGVAKFIDDKTSAVIISPGIGLRVLGLDVQAKFEKWMDHGSGWGVKVGYNF